MKVLPPGTLLQLMYLRERVRRLKPGQVTRLLLDQGWTGWVYDLEEKTIELLKTRFAQEIAEKRLMPLNRDYLSSPAPEKVDLVISCMVMEHLEAEAESNYMTQSASRIKDGGMMIGMVPPSPDHWRDICH